MTKETNTINPFLIELRELLIKHNVELGVDIDGDTHGVSTSFIVIDVYNKEHVVNSHSAYLDAYDITLYLD